MSTTYLTRVKISFLSLFFIQHTFVLASNSPHGDRYIVSHVPQRTVAIFNSDHSQLEQSGGHSQ